MSDDPKNRHAKRKNVRAVKIIKVGDPYYYFFFFTEGENGATGITEIEVSFDLSVGEPIDNPVIEEYLSQTFYLRKEEMKIENITPHCIKAEFPREVRIGAADYPLIVTLKYVEDPEGTTQTVSYDLIVFKTELAYA